MNYHTGCHKLREAYFKWRNSTKYVKNHNVVSFTAGYNAALADIKTNTQTKSIKVSMDSGNVQRGKSEDIPESIHRFS